LGRAAAAAASKVAETSGFDGSTFAIRGVARNLFRRGTMGVWGQETLSGLQGRALMGACGRSPLYRPMLITIAIMC